MNMRPKNNALNQARIAEVTGISTINPTTITAAAFVCALVLSVLFTGSLAQAQTDASQIALQHPGWVQLPGALVRPDCVHRIPKGAGPRIENGRDTGDVVLNGIVIAHYDPCSEDATIRFAQKSSESAVDNSNGSGLVEWSYWDDASLGSSDEIDFVGNELTVPSKPTRNDDVTAILLWNGIEDSTGKYIFAPTLEYGQDFGNNLYYWTIVASFVTPGGGYISFDKKVSAGDSLSLFTEILAKTGSTYHWRVEAQDLTTGAVAYLDSPTTDLHFNLAVSGALTVEGVSSCPEYPAAEAVFTGTVVDHGFPSYNKLSPKWVGETYAYGGPSCNFSVTPGTETILQY
jgi:hypothetical protein